MQQIQQQQQQHQQHPHHRAKLHSPKEIAVGVTAERREKTALDYLQLAARILLQTTLNRAIHPSPSNKQQTKPQMVSEHLHQHQHHKADAEAETRIINCKCH